MKSGLLRKTLAVVLKYSALTPSFSVLAVMLQQYSSAALTLAING